MLQLEVSPVSKPSAKSGSGEVDKLYCMSSRIPEETIDWLLAGDPAVKWQVQRDLLHRAPSTWQATRRRVAREGWGARLLALRQDDGMWGGGLYQPKWTSTFYTMRVLVHLGIPPSHRQAVASCRLMLDEGVTRSGGVSLWSSGVPDTCVTAMLLDMACYFGFATDERGYRMARWLLNEQMRDGGWNCERRRGATHSSFHTTISTLEGLTAMIDAGQSCTPLGAATASAREFFLQHQLYRSSRTGKIIRSSFARPSFPPRWYFDVLRGLEHFSAIDAPWDPRLAAAVAEIEKRRLAGCRWKLQNKHSGKVHFDLEPTREPSRINTLRVLRVLRWAERAKEADLSERN